jgi:hypothetical protein
MVENNHERRRPMRGRTAFLAVALGTFAVVLSAETWTNVSVIDSMCVDKAKGNPDKHTVKCALACEDGGYGILTADGKFLKFDEGGNAKTVAALQATKKTDALRVTVDGTLSGDEIQVKSLKLD